MELEITSGGKKFRHVGRGGTLFIRIGNSTDSDICLPDDPGVSSLHAKIENFMGRWTITDQMSDTGTRVNGQSISSIELKPGDTIQVGAATLRVLNLEHSAAQSAPAPTTPTQPTPAKQERPPAASASPLPVPFRPTSTQQPTPQAQFSRELQQHLRAGQAKKSNVVGVLVVLGIVTCVVIGIIQSVVESMGEVPMEDEIESSCASPKRASPTAPATRSSTPTGKEVTAKENQSFRARIAYLTARATTLAWAERLKQLDAIIEELKTRQHSLEHSIHGARISLEQGLINEMSLRCGKDQTDVFELVEAKNFREALARLDALKAYAEQTDYHKQSVSISGIKDYLEPKIEQVTQANRDFLVGQFIKVDAALALNNYGIAATELQKLSDNARIEEAMQPLLARELGIVSRQARLQQQGDLEAPREPFNKTKSKLPAAPKNELLPQGDASASKFISSLRSKLLKAAKAGQLPDAATVLHGREATLHQSDGWRLTLNVTRPMPDATGKLTPFTLQFAEQPQNLPAATLLPLYERLTSTGRDDWLGMLMFCYENGLMDDAPRLAFKLWQADPAVKTSIDALMAAKLGIAVPAGGFIEQNGRLVVP